MTGDTLIFINNIALPRRAEVFIWNDQIFGSLNQPSITRLNQLLPVKYLFSTLPI